MTRPSMTGRLLALISAALPMAVTVAAAQDVAAIARPVRISSRVKPISAALVQKLATPVWLPRRSDQPDAALQASTVFR